MVDSTNKAESNNNTTNPETLAIDDSISKYQAIENKHKTKKAKALKPESKSDKIEINASSDVSFTKTAEYNLVKKSVTYYLINVFILPLLIVILILATITLGLFIYRFFYPSEIFNINKTDIKDFYTKVSINDVKNWGKDDRIINVIPTFVDSCKVFANYPDSRIISNYPQVTTAKNWKDTCNKLLNLNLPFKVLFNKNQNQSVNPLTNLDVNLSGSELQKYNKTLQNFIANNFNIYLVNKPQQSKITGYYRIELEGSLTKTNEYRYPIYGVPQDLIKVNLGKFEPNLNGQTIYGRVENGELVHYYTRAQINKGFLTNKNLELVWLKNPIDAFLLHVQGSGVVTLPNGKIIYVSYAAKNGLKFSGIETYMLKDDITYKRPPLPVKGLELMYKFYELNSDKINEILNHDNSYIFFKIVDKQKWTGAFGTPMYQERNVAVDPKFEPLGVPIWLSMMYPSNNLKEKQDFNKLVIANDVGSAIVGPGRLDFYWGIGKDAGAIASYTNQNASVYMFLPKTKKLQSKKSAN